MDRNHRPTDIHQKVVEFIDSGRSFAVALVLNAAAVTVPEIAAGITAQLIAVRRKSNPHLPPSEKELP